MIFPVPGEFEGQVRAVMLAQKALHGQSHHSLCDTLHYSLVNTLKLLLIFINILSLSYLNQLFVVPSLLSLHFLLSSFVVKIGLASYQHTGEDAFLFRRLSNG